MTWLCAIGDWIAEHATVISAVISAIATGFIALFTTKLTGATVGLRAAADQQHLDTVESLKLTRDSLALTRDEFNATHRPEIIAYGFEVFRERVEDQGYVVGQPICARFAVVNKGTGDAIISDIGGRIVFDEHFRPGMPLPTCGIQNRTLAAGEVLRDIVIAGDSKQSAAADFNAGFPSPSNPHLLCIGLIVYEDAEGRRRETGFSRSFEKGDRWVRMDNSEQDYAY
jgi:hypothetical protein